MRIPVPERLSRWRYADSVGVLGEQVLRQAEQPADGTVDGPVSIDDPVRREHGARRVSRCTALDVRAVVGRAPSCAPRVLQRGRRIGRHAPSSGRTYRP